MDDRSSSMDPDLSYGYLKMCWERNTTHATYRVEKGKMVKTYEDHNFLLETRSWENE